MTEEDLRETFVKIGEVISTKIIMDNETGRSKVFRIQRVRSKPE